MAMIVRVGGRSLNAVTKFVRVLKPRVQKFNALASVEMAIPSRAEFMSSVNGVNMKNVGEAVSNMTVNEIAARGIVVGEIAMWFYVGEIIGRGSLIGYNPNIE